MNVEGDLQGQRGRLYSTQQGDGEGREVEEAVAQHGGYCGVFA